VPSAPPLPYSAIDDSQGRRQKNFQGGRGNVKKTEK